MKPKSRITRILGALLSVAILAACSSNPSSPTVVPNTTNKWTGPVGKINMRLKMPSPKRQAQIAKLVSHAETARGMKPNYFPGTATTLVFRLTKIGSTFTSGSTPYDFTVTLSTCAATTPFACTVVGGTAATANCQEVSSAWSCALHTDAPAAADTFLIESTDAGHNILSQSSLIINVSAGLPATGSFSLDPVVAKMTWTSGWISSAANIVGANGNSGGGNGPTEPTFTAGIGYTCPSAPTTYCSDPLVNGNSVAANDNLTLNFVDADGNNILPVSGDTSPNIPIYISAGGNEIDVGVICTNSDVEWLNGSYSGNPNPVTYTTLAAAEAASTSTPEPGQVATPTPAYMANGSESQFSGATTKFLGNGNPSAGQPYINSPETGKDGTVGGGTTGNGVVISDAIYTNNGAWLNYDGGGNATTGATSWFCEAIPSTGIAAIVYYIGYAEGTVSGISHRKVQGKIHI